MKLPFLIYDVLIVLPYVWSEIPQFMEEIKNDLSVELYSRLDEENKEYNPNAIEQILNETRRDNRWGGWENSNWGAEVYGNQRNRGTACVLIQVSYKNAIRYIRQYFYIRATYIENLEYEMGFLSHEIIFRYRIMLELYQIIETLFKLHPKINAAPHTIMFYFYSNIVEESKAIIHLCNAMHEIEAKYKQRSYKKVHESLFNDFSDAKNRHNKSAGLTMEKEYELYVKMQIREQQKRKRQLEKQRKRMQKFGWTPKKVVTTKKRRFPLHYGWSIEDW